VLSAGGVSIYLEIDYRKRTDFERLLMLLMLLVGFGIV
jgi:hypothetical protein